jgi:hypothetical protein
MPSTPARRIPVEQRPFRTPQLMRRIPASPTTRANAGQTHVNALAPLCPSLARPLMRRIRPIGSPRRRRRIHQPRCSAIERQPVDQAEAAIVPYVARNSKYHGAKNRANDYPKAPRIRLAMRRREQHSRPISQRPRKSGDRAAQARCDWRLSQQRLNRDQARQCKRSTIPAGIGRSAAPGDHHYSRPPVHLRLPPFLSCLGPINAVELKVEVPSTS